MKFKKGILIEQPLQKGSFMLRCWEYRINGLRVGIVFKQDYGSQGIIYRYTICLRITSLWFETAVDQMDEYPQANPFKSRKEALQGLKLSLKHKLKILDKLKETL